MPSFKKQRATKAKVPKAEPEEKSITAEEEAHRPSDARQAAADEEKDDGGATENKSYDVGQVHLTEMQIMDLRNVFELFDEDKSGTINIDELGNALRTLGHKTTPAELAEMMEEMDTDQSGTGEGFQRFARC